MCAGVCFAVCHYLPAVLVITARNWLYLITVTYKISRRLALLRPAPLPARLSGAALTFVGVFLGLWQSVAYTAMDAAFEIVLCKAIVFGLSQCSLVAVIAWKVWAGFGQCRTASNVWHLSKLAFREARLLVMAPHALLVNNQALVSASFRTMSCCMKLGSLQITAGQPSRIPHSAFEWSGGRLRSSSSAPVVL